MDSGVGAPVHGEYVVDGLNDTENIYFIFWNINLRSCDNKSVVGITS